MKQAEANEQVKMVCYGLPINATEVPIDATESREPQGCGITKQCRLGDFYGDHPRNVCPDCGGLLLEDRRGKTPRPTAKDHGWN
jgi:hypothetical protein